MPTPRSFRAPAAAMAAGLLAFTLLLPACGGGRSDLSIRESGDRAFVDGDYEKAVADYTEAYNLNPGDARANFNLGRALVKAGEPEKGREHLFVAYSIRPQSDEYLVGLADALVATNRKDELYRVLRERIVGRGATTDYIRLADYSRQVGDADKAEQALITASRLEGGASKDIHLLLSDFYASEKAETKAIDRLRMAFWIDPSDPKITEKARALGEIPGPTFGMRPAEMP